MKCNYCGVETKNPKYCSLTCSKPHQLEQYELDTAARMVRGEVSQNVTIRKYLIKTRGEVCSLCGMGAVHNRLPLVLQVDHIDGNSDNNLPENLRLLCPNCHSQTDTFSTRSRKNTKRNRYLRRFKGSPEL